MKIKFRYLVILFLINSFLMWFCATFRKNDYMTGAFLIMIYFAPAIFIQSVILLLAYLKPMSHKIVFYVLSFITLLLIIFLIYFISLGS